MQKNLFEQKTLIFKLDVTMIKIAVNADEGSYIVFKKSSTTISMSQFNITAFKFKKMISVIGLNNLVLDHP